MNLEKIRMESDSIGEMEVPADAYYGVQSFRAKQNFPITGNKLHPLFIQNLAKIKKKKNCNKKKKPRRTHQPECSQASCYQSIRHHQSLR